LYLPAVITCIIAFPLDEILKVVIPHVTVQNLLYLILFLAIDDSWGRVMLATWNVVRECYGQLDYWEDWVKTLEPGCQGQAVGSVSDVGFNYEWAESLIG
jgi:hypothetical protein